MRSVRGRAERIAGQRFPTPYLTVMDRGHDERDFVAGHVDRASGLSDDLRAMMGLRSAGKGRCLGSTISYPLSRAKVPSRARGG